MSSGGTTRRLPGAARIDTMSWSPNGRWLSYLDDDGEPPSRTLTLDLRTWKAAPASVPVSTLLADSDECFPSWSPDSTRLLLDGESAAFVPGAWGYAGPVLLTVATGRYTVPLSTSGGALPEMRTMDDEYMAGMTWIDAHHLLVQTDAALVPGDTGGGDDLYVKTIP
jgi:Tol biopolymer transport system component